MYTYIYDYYYVYYDKEEEKNLILLKSKYIDIPVACLGTYVCNIKFHSFMKWALLSTSGKRKFTDLSCFLKKKSSKLWILNSNPRLSKSKLLVYQVPCIC